jgi:hypothetical protein
MDLEDTYFLTLTVAFLLSSFHFVSSIFIKLYSFTIKQQSQIIAQYKWSSIIVLHKK